MHPEDRDLTINWIERANEWLDSAPTNLIHTVLHSKVAMWQSMPRCAAWHQLREVPSNRLMYQIGLWPAHRPVELGRHWPGVDGEVTVAPAVQFVVLIPCDDGKGRESLGFPGFITRGKDEGGMFESVAEIVAFIEDEATRIGYRILRFPVVPQEAP